MAVNFEYEGGTLTSFIIGDVDHHTSSGLRQKIDEKVLQIRPSVLCLDFEKVTFMDSSGVGLVMGRYKNVMPLRCKVKVIGLNDKMMKIMKMSGLERIVELERIDVK